ncbi:S-adenosyl-L-methionine-dependent methyltransferase [Wilcoxina mikolae CBS 423.85]|nr:S-adenosyl-L-methionine-dependent methyltransferase [Wilcoxina mikolae CBS 423.85]
MSDSTPNHGELIEVDPAVLINEEKEDYASSGYDTSTASLSSSINEYIFENGRRYHAYFGVDKNLMPTDEKEQDRLDMHHEIMLQLLGGKLHLAPIDAPQKILDIGTGTGIWAIDVADTYPSAEVVGTDLSPIQPVWVPPNCKFEVDDAEKDWTFATDSFDFIHSRNLYQAISNLPKVLSEIYRCAKPGAYVELAELGMSGFSDDNTLGSGFRDYCDKMDMAFVKMNRPQASAAALRERLETAGFVDVVVETVKQPFGPWPRQKKMKQLGAMVMLNAEAGLEAYGIAVFTRVLGMEVDEAKALCAGAWKDITNKNHHAYSLFFIAYGRKPEAK